MANGFRQTATTLSLAWMVAIGGHARACCPAWRAGSPITIADQKILVVWDPDSKTEHFIRSAGFRGAARRGEEPSKADGAGFGFLVPSPTQPEVATADAAVFDGLDQAIRPRIEVIDRWRADPTPLLLMPFQLSKQAMNARMGHPPTMSDVRVLERKQVGQYDVAVLQADDARALSDWLAANGFDSRPALQEWAEPYVAKGWIITAFRYAENAARVETDAVRMSFTTDVPMFAYRVPTDNLANADGGPPPNRLRAFVVLPGRANGTLGEGDSAHGWAQAQCRYSRPIAPDALAALIGGAVPADAAQGPAGAWLTAFDDPTWPSGTEDLRFTYQPDGAQYQEVERHFNQRTIPLPLDVIGLTAAAAVWGARRRFA